MSHIFVMYSKKVEECLKQADELRAQTVSD